MVESKPVSRIICPKCRTSCLQGSPYCSQCGAPLTGPAVVPDWPEAGQDGEILERFLREGQDEASVIQIVERASQFLAFGEEIEYIVTANKTVAGFVPDCVIATDRRLIDYKKKMLGRTELEDCPWRDIRHIDLREGRCGVQLRVATAEGWRLIVECLPRGQAVRLYEVAAQRNARVRTKLQEMLATLGASPQIAPQTPQAPQSTRSAQIAVPASTLLSRERVEAAATQAAQHALKELQTPPPAQVAQAPQISQVPQVAPVAVPSTNPSFAGSGLLEASALSGQARSQPVPSPDRVEPAATQTMQQPHHKMQAVEEPQPPRIPVSPPPPVSVSVSMAVPVISAHLAAPASTKAMPSDNRERLVEVEVRPESAHAIPSTSSGQAVEPGIAQASGGLPALAAASAPAIDQLLLPMASMAANNPAAPVDLPEAPASAMPVSEQPLATAAALPAEDLAPVDEQPLTSMSAPKADEQPRFAAATPVNDPVPAEEAALSPIEALSTNEQATQTTASIAAPEDELPDLPMAAVQVEDPTPVNDLPPRVTAAAAAAMSEQPAGGAATLDGASESAIAASRSMEDLDDLFSALLRKTKPNPRHPGKLTLSEMALGAQPGPPLSDETTLEQARPAGPVDTEPAEIEEVAEVAEVDEEPANLPPLLRYPGRYREAPGHMSPAISNASNGNAAYHMQRPDTPETSRDRIRPAFGFRQVRSSSESPMRKLRQLKRLLDEGLITEADYEAKKANILSQI